VTIDVTTGDEPLLQESVRSTRDALPVRIRSPVDDIVVAFGGWGSMEAGEQLPEHERTATAELAARIRGLPTDALHRLRVAAFQGSLRDPEGVGVVRGFDFIRANFHPLGRLILYGYSAGGFDAMRLASHIWLARRFYEATTNVFVRDLPPPTARAPGLVFGYTRVDLLVTVDAAVGPISGMTQRRIWPCVRRNVNYYQTHPASSVGSHGGPNTPMDQRATAVDNRNWTARYNNQPDQAHGAIDNDTMDAVVTLIRGLIGTPEIPTLLPRGTAAG